MSTAFIFPGQGSQFPGMVRDLLRCGPDSRALLRDAERITGLPVTDLMTTAGAEVIADPHVAQVLVFVTDTVLWSELSRNGFAADAVAGHSLGEYAALVAAQVLPWESALRLVDARGAAMAAAAATTPGAMAALVGLDHVAVAELCRSATRDDDFAVVANVNSPTQLVISGTECAVTTVIERAQAAGALRARRLPVGGAYHSRLMRPAADRLRPLIENAPLSRPATPLVSSATGSVVTDLEEYRTVLAGQITAPVRWRATVGALIEYGVDSFIEVGPGKVLSGLCRDNARDAARHRAPELLLHIPTRLAAGA